MSSLDIREVRRPLSESTVARLDAVDAFASIGSTNTHLLKQALPAPGHFRVAIADEQTAGRGRQSRRWVSPPGAGLYLSLAYTFGHTPAHLPALTLALGVGVIATLESFGDGAFRLKWPNDIIAGDGKLGGILTEARSGSGAGVTVVAGIGINIHLPDDLEPPTGEPWPLPPIDLASVVGPVPSREQLAGLLIEALAHSVAGFEASGFDGFAKEWRRRDWLKGRRVAADVPGGSITGVAAGVDSSGALLLDGPDGTVPIASGSITAVEKASTRA